MATKAELIAEITAFYAVVGTPFETTSSDSHVPEQINTYSIIVYETGLSEKSKKPVLRSKYINFIVYDEYQPGEAAYYADDELTNEVNKDVTSDNSLSSIHNLYLSEIIRGRVQACVARSAQDILNESLPESVLTADASVGQRNVTVEKGFMFWVDKKVILFDTNNAEELTVESVAGNVVTMTTNLIHSYTTAASGTLKYLDDKERQQWAANVLLNPDVYTLCMTSLVSLDTTVQTSGGACTDANIKFVVDSFINKVAVASYV